jgi:hypothetical protein
MLYKKISEGYVEQTFNDVGECIAQHFVAGELVVIANEDGDPINSMDMPLGGREYFPFDMKQPSDYKEG